jgi:phage repressor protein C with HTH and peptisase S24 domain
MQPTLLAGDVVLVCRWIKGREGDLVVAKKNAVTLVKRVREKRGNDYFLVGDNPLKSTDSEDFGTVHSDQIFGKILGRAWSGFTNSTKSQDSQ